MGESGPMEAVLERDFFCPQCAYNLRGLSSVTAVCPECGEKCDVAKMLARVWTEPWYKAPGFERLMGPVIIATFGPAAAGLLTVLLSAVLGFGALPVFVLLMLGTAGLWVVSVVHIYREMKWEGVRLAIMGHAVLVIELAGIGGLVGGIFMTIAGLMRDPMPGGLPLAVAVLGGLVLWGGRRGEGHIAERCIRGYLGRG